ncbi:MAG: hypothetical protein PHU85_00430 [Phycisphaerae bacterium]|nr:hypothetical protein [Phycisphaerae bacterium]
MDAECEELLTEARALLAQQEELFPVCAAVAASRLDLEKAEAYGRRRKALGARITAWELRCKLARVRPAFQNEMAGAPCKP